MIKYSPFDLNGVDGSQSVDAEPIVYLFAGSQQLLWPHYDVRVHRRLPDVREYE